MTLPAVTPQINVDEYELSRIQSNLAGTTDAILSFLTTNFTILATGAPATVNAPSTIPQAPAYPLLAPNGTSSAPSYSFAGAPGVGMCYDAGSSRLTFSGRVNVTGTADMNFIYATGINSTGTITFGGASTTINSTAFQVNTASVFNGDVQFNQDAHFSTGGVAGFNLYSWAGTVKPTNYIYNGATSFISFGTGVPSYVAHMGSLFLRTDGGAGTTLYINETGTSTWRAI